MNRILSYGVDARLRTSSDPRSQHIIMHAKLALDSNALEKSLNAAYFAAIYALCSQ